jgi:ATP-dependent helicase/nuclease subunit A
MFAKTAAPKSITSTVSILAKNLIILASAGSGKTFQLGNRVIGLVAAGIKPEEIVALTFTRKAAGEFADSVLGKLAKAAADSETSKTLGKTLALPEADFALTLERIVRSLPRFTLTTIDAFFSRVVRTFQYELGVTGGGFELIEGPRATALADEILAAVLGNTLSAEDGETFGHAFRRATFGRENQGVLRLLGDFIGRWQDIHRQQSALEWGPDHLGAEVPEVWEKNKLSLADAVRSHLGGVSYTTTRQPEALARCVDLIAQHTIGSGSLGAATPKLLGDILEAVASGDGELRVKLNKEFSITGPCATHLRALVGLAAACELGAAIRRTRAIREVVTVYDSLCAKRLRGRGLLGFQDIKILMGQWARDETARLRREAVDFRLDASYHHWLLDEFQDTSRADWLGLLPLVDEAATGEDGTMFIVGDRKQAIYAWRGGDVRLFDEVAARYAGGLDTLTMAESWRSCPEVLALVNRVCGDTATMAGLFGTAATRWQWQDHYPAAPLAAPDRCGESRVEVVGNWEERLERLASLLEELGIGHKAMTCGVLLRGNEKAGETAGFLRDRGFDVIEEGRRKPAGDNPVGVLISHLVQWLADPSDDFSREVIRMSPLADRILENGDGFRMSAWEKLTARIAASGFAETIGSLLSDHLPQWSDFGKRRAADLLAALEAIDHEGITSAREAAAWLQRLEVTQSPGIAAVQVMTIHKSKGLGFDVVILPEIPSDILPLSHRFDIAEGPGWITGTPPKWARDIMPEIRRAEERWAADQRYEGFCALYVALTRAKRGLYVLMEPPAKSADPDKASLANWMRQSLGAGENTGVIHRTGSPSWIDFVPGFTPSPPPHAPPPGAAVPVAARATPTGRLGETGHASRNAAGIAFGNAVHTLLENIRWADEDQIELPATVHGDAVARMLDHPALDNIFHRRGRDIRLLTEQPVDWFGNGVHTTGIIDRLLLHPGSEGRPALVHIIDFKTDAVDDPALLRERYRPQMESYAAAFRLMHPHAAIRCTLVSVRHCAPLDLAV